MYVPSSAFSRAIVRDHESHQYVRIGLAVNLENLQFDESADRFYSELCQGRELPPMSGLFCTGCHVVSLHRIQDI